MYGIIKKTEISDNFGWHTNVSMLGVVLTDDKKLAKEQALALITKDVEKVTEQWEEDERPKVKLKNIKSEYFPTQLGFTFNDDEEGDLTYAENVWTYYVEEIKECI